MVVGDGARVDVLEGGEEGREVWAPGRMIGGGVGSGGFGDVVLDWSRLVGGLIFWDEVGRGGGGRGWSGVEYFRRMPWFIGEGL